METSTRGVRQAIEALLVTQPILALLVPAAVEDNKVSQGLRALLKQVRRVPPERFRRRPDQLAPLGLPVNKENKVIQDLRALLKRARRVPPELEASRE